MGKATVFANDMSIAAKYCDGKSSLQLVDVCHSPGKGRPKPYKNTAYAKQLANASTSVFISQLPVAQKDKSYFANSTGNEKATRKYGMGIKTHVIKGGAYFVDWSPDVFIEGYNVPRHNDMMTHNHVNQPNTGYWVYKDSWLRSNYCKKNEDKVIKKCSINRDRKKFNKKGKGKQKDAKNWKQAHCDGLGIKPSTESIADLKDSLSETIGSYEDLFSNSFDIVKERISEEVKDFAIKMGLKVVARSAVGAFIPVAGWIFAAGSAAYSAAEIAAFTADMDDLIKDFKAFQQEFKKFQQGSTGETLKKIQNGAEVDAKELADLMYAWAEINPCIRAKRCQLQAFSPGTAKAKEVVKDNNSTKIKDTGENGCCKGQTAHHVIPDTWMKGFESCPEYEHKAGLSICVEGTSHSQGGSHEKIHTELDKILKNKKLLDTASKPRKVLQPEISFDDAKKIAVNSILQTFPLSGCSAKCLLAQIEDYYDELCDSTSGSMPLKDHKSAATFKPDEETVL